MKKVIVIGSGIAGMSNAIHLASYGVNVELVSPLPSEQSQSVMAAGGINAVLSDHLDGDSISSHIDDTLKGGAFLGGKDAVSRLCENAPDIIKYLEKIGVVFSIDETGRPIRRAFGGQSHNRTCYCGASTGKQIVNGLDMEVRRFEAEGLIRRRLRSFFHSALIEDGVCYGAIIYNMENDNLEAIYSDALVIATGGQNLLFGKTTGSNSCDGYAAGRLFMQGVELKNLEFIQYHPTTLRTSNKKMLISEAVRGEGGRLFYEENGKRVYFMEDKYGPNGNLMTRDVVSREIEFCAKQVYLDISFLDLRKIDRLLPEVRDLCMKYKKLDISKEPIPIEPSVHFFMGGIAVKNNHETNIRNLYAIGECASIYHGANRLGGNSMLGAFYSGMVSAKDIAAREFNDDRPEFNNVLREEEDNLDKLRQNLGNIPIEKVKAHLAEVMNNKLGIVRSCERLEEGIKEIDYYLSNADNIFYDSRSSMYTNYSLYEMLILARATLICANNRRESRGAHYRSDYPDTKEDDAFSTIISYDDGKFKVRFDKERCYEG